MHHHSGCGTVLSLQQSQPGAKALSFPTSLPCWRLGPASLRVRPGALETWHILPLWPCPGQKCGYSRCVPGGHCVGSCSPSRSNPRGHVGQIGWGRAPRKRGPWSTAAFTYLCAQAPVHQLLGFPLPSLHSLLPCGHPSPLPTPSFPVWGSGSQELPGACYKLLSTAQACTCPWLGSAWTPGLCWVPLWGPLSELSLTLIYTSERPWPLPKPSCGQNCGT